jgi:hypothetical protein
MSGHSVRVRKIRWEKVEKKAWELSTKAQKIIKPTDIADALFFKYINEITIEDIENAKKTRSDE